ncbi:flagellar protein FlaG [Variovorax arabinosiphilus]|uniref:flagellar protein FlaG n=1 Tax=Variovorax arabinosiphilus TaxID=3053498 RepID=UPI002576A65E|nr:MULTISPECIES: flagellar protein FlaG [unclassified Variovorax]MDM0118181.1 flagellar protein FlaG [Variovorax sp. J2L1-78]MDM0128606.1 flagellar protein FlaG [Variovorax sp. J2L1-63]MDM0233608.1 flagellar protein FlaG [Variovorax sp. J2R1-6]
MSNPVPASAAPESPWMQLAVGRAAPAASSASRVADDAEPEATPVQVEAAVKQVNAALEIRSIGIQFEIDKDTDKVIVKVIDRNTGEVIRQVPNEEVVRIAKVMGEMSGLLVDSAA